MTIRIAMWSGPRNISTAMMRAWSSRPDTVVVDEPFYAAYLAQTGLEHPMREEILASQSNEWTVVAQECATSTRAPVIFQKHMCQHMVPQAPTDWMTACRHAFLIRPPGEVAASFGKMWDGWGAEDLGFRRQGELFDHVCQIAGQVPPVVLAADVLANPEGMLRALCDALGVLWDPAMLSWRAGPHEDDGVWAAHWYNAVLSSTGFGPPPDQAQSPDSSAAEAVFECEQYFQAMLAHRLSPR